MNYGDLDTHDLRRIMRERHDKTLELEEQLAACKAENQALAEALQACLPLVEDALQNSKELQDSHYEAGRTMTSDRHGMNAKSFELQANHIRSLLGLP